MWPTRIRRRITPVADTLVGLDSVWLFGSATRIENPHDIDLLAVYDRDIIAPSEVHLLGDALNEALVDNELGICIILLHRREHLSSRFSAEEDAIQVWP